MDSEMNRRLAALREEALAVLGGAADAAALEVWRVKYLGKKGELSGVLRGLSALAPEDRPAVGQLANEVRSALEDAYGKRRGELEDLERKAREADETLDVTLPGRTAYPGSEHPLRYVMRRIEDTFIGMGFTIEEGPEAELDYYNFEALNFPKDHPTRDMQDTFYLSEDILMRTHTSPMQARTLERRRPETPVRILVPGRVYRRDDDDATHSHAFTQIEGLAVDEGIRMSDLKGTLLAFVRELFGEGQEVRLRPSFFPFTEPGAELDMRCIYCGGTGCGTCKHTGWIEILGCGMVHPNVLRYGGYDPGKVSGFAFGMGVERIAMLLFGVEDVRQFYLNDVRLLRQFSALPG